MRKQIALGLACFCSALFFGSFSSVEANSHGISRTTKEAVYAAEEYDSYHEHHNSIEYGSFYTKSNSKIAPEHAIPFDHETVIPTSGIEHVAGTGDFIIRNPGVYRVIYSVGLQHAGGAVALALDGRVIPGSEMFVAENEHLSTLALLINVCGRSCCDEWILNVVNNNSLTSGWLSHDINLKSGHSSATSCEGPNVTASIVIERVGDCVERICCPVPPVCR